MSDIKNLICACGWIFRGVSMKDHCPACGFDPQNPDMVMANNARVARLNQHISDELSDIFKSRPGACIDAGECE